MNCCSECSDYDREWEAQMLTKNLIAVDTLMSLRAKSRTLSLREDELLREIVQVIILRSDIDAQIDQLEKSR